MIRYAQYQEVRVAAPAADNAEYAGLTGAIVGIGDAPGYPVIYGVLFPDREHLGSFGAEELAPTGRHFRREDLYDDTRRLRVRVDRAGRGELA